MAGAAHAPVGRASVVGRELRAVGAAQGGGQRAQAQLLHRVREEAHRPVALQAILAQLRAVPAAQAPMLRNTARMTQLPFPLIIPEPDGQALATWYWRQLGDPTPCRSGIAGGQIMM